MKKFKEYFKEMRTELDRLFNPKTIDTSMLKKTRYQLKNGYEVKVQLANDQDVENIMEIQKACYGGKAPWSRLTVYNELKNLHSFFLIVDYYGEGLAFAAASLKKGHLHITNIGTKPVFQRQGLAEFLIDRIAEIAKELELGSLTLEVRVSNNKAKNLYYKIGFIDRYIKEAYYTNNGEDALEMIYFIDQEDEEIND